MQEGASVPVTLGRADSVAAVPREDPRLLVEKSKIATIDVEIQLEESAKAPVAAGQQLGMMTVRAGEEILAQVPLVAEGGVEKLGWGDLMEIVLRKVAMSASTHFLGSSPSR